MGLKVSGHLIVVAVETIFEVRVIEVTVVAVETEDGVATREEIVRRQKCNLN